MKLVFVNPLRFATAVYAATAAGLGVSTDGGSTYVNRTTTQGLGSNTVRGVYASGIAVYAATTGGLSVSVNGATSFTNKTTADGLGSDTTNDVFAVGSTVYVATAGGVSTSIDSGTTFTNKTTAAGLGSNTVNGVYAVDGIVYAATRAGLSISTDGGTSYTNYTTANGLGSNTVNAVLAVGNTVYAATGGGVSISTDGGTRYTNYTTANGLGSNTVNAVYVVGSTVYAATDAGLAISTDGGMSYTNYTTANGLGSNAVDGVFVVGDTVYAVTGSGLSRVPAVSGSTSGEPIPTPPAICLNMIVRDEAHVVREVLDAVAPYIASWVIVDTGSVDGTPDVVREHMAGLGIPGELHQRPWRDFGTNRSEALSLAQGHGDYIWVMDADDMVVGTIDFNGLSADVYSLRYGTGFSYWRRQVFRDGMPWRYVGVVHEYPACDVPFAEGRLEGDYHLESRRLGGRNMDPRKYERDRDLLLAEVQRNPQDVRSVFYLAQTYFDLGDFGSAHYWYARRAEMGDFDEEVYYSLYRVAESMSRLDEPWPQVQDAYLKAWEFRPTRAEPLYAIAYRCRTDGRYQLGYLFAERAAQIPLPETDVLFVNADVYHWRALDEQAVCASWIGKNSEAYELFQGILASGYVPDDHRARIAGNRDFCAARSSPPTSSSTPASASASHPEDPGAYHRVAFGGP